MRAHATSASFLPLNASSFTVPETMAVWGSRVDTQPATKGTTDPSDADASVMNACNGNPARETTSISLRARPSALIEAISQCASEAGRYPIPGIWDLQKPLLTGMLSAEPAPHS